MLEGRSGLLGCAGARGAPPSDKSGADAAARGRRAACRLSREEGHGAWEGGGDAEPRDPGGGHHRLTAPRP